MPKPLSATTSQADILFSNPMHKVREVEARLAQLRATSPLALRQTPQPRPKTGPVTSLAPRPLNSMAPRPHASLPPAMEPGAKPPSQPPQRIHRIRLGEVLLQRGLITQEQLDLALGEQKRRGLRIGSALVELGFIGEKDMVSALAEHLGVEVILQDDIQIDPSARDVLSIDVIKRHEVVPLFADSKMLRIAMADPTNLAVVDELRFQTGRWIQVVLTSEATIRALIASTFSTETLMTEAMQGAVLPADELNAIETLKLEEEEENHDIWDLLNSSADKPVVNFVNYLLSESTRRGASDIHIEPFETSLRVRFRIDGEMMNIVSPPRRLHTPVVSRIKVMSGMDISKRRVPQDGHMAVRHHGQILHYRVSTLPTVFGEKAVLRLLTKDASLADLNRLGIGDDELRRLRRAIAVPQGLVLVTGPTGSGKTTTVHAALNAIAKPTVNVMTLEDPVEVTLPGVNHVQIKEGTGVSFSEGLRSLLRQDPDVIFVGEMRDTEVSRIAIRASLTGHLVLSTLHTNSALECFERLDDMAIERYLVAATIQTVVAQRLLRRVCSTCAQPTSFEALAATVQPEIIAALRAEQQSAPPPPPLKTEAGSDARPEPGPPPPGSVMVGQGCERCLKTGHKGRLGVYEALPIDRGMRDLLRRRVPISEVREAAMGRGFKSLYEHGLSMVLRGQTSPHEVQRVLLQD